MKKLLSSLPAKLLLGIVVGIVLGLFVPESVMVVLVPIKNILNVEYIVHGKWELNVAKILNKQNIIWNNKTYLTYNTDIQRTYHPDFYLPELNVYIEVKG